MAQFVPRLTDSGMRGSKYYYSDNIFYNAGYGLPNCTAYAWGRWYEITGKKPTGLSTGNANDWYGHSDSYKRGTTPQLGAILCLHGGIFSGDGHVAVVEEIHDDGSITTSSSAYNGFYFRTFRGTVSNTYGYDYGGYTFQGFIYNPDEPIPPDAPTGNKNHKMPLWMYLNPYC